MTSPATNPDPGLPLAGQPVAERVDAARNRVRLLDAAARLVRERGAEHVTMEAVANAAGVGKGTVYRRFGDRAGLMFALLDHAERTFQEDFLTGPPPLGPGAPPRERLAAFGVATIRHQIRYLDLYLQAEPKPARQYSPHPPYEVRTLHLASLLRAAGVPGDLDVIAEVLGSYLGTPFLNRLHSHRRVPAERIEAGWRDLVDRLVG
ncbi:helix-turn-helix domain-containing protein [Micromonosporaceae bacterium B7E4]